MGGDGEGEGERGSRTSRESGVKFQTVISQKWLELTISVYGTQNSQELKRYRLVKVMEL